MAKQPIKSLLKTFSYYFVDFFISVIIGLTIAIVLNIPMKFMKFVNIDLGSFIVQFLGMCIALYIRCYSRGYNANTYTYKFQFNKVILFVLSVFGVQSLLVLLIGGHAVYISGPTCFLSSYILPAADRALVEGRAMIAFYDWLFMFLADILIYAPIMIAGEYWGHKQNKKEIAEIEKA